MHERELQAWLRSLSIAFLMHYQGMQSPTFHERALQLIAMTDEQLAQALYFHAALP